MVRIVLIVGALLVAGLAGWMVQRYLAAERASLAAAQSQPTPAPLPTTDVLVVTANVPVAGVVTANAMRWQSWPEANLNPNYVVRAARPDAIEKLAGSAARQPLFAGEPVTEAKLVKRNSAGFLAATLPEGRRAVTLKVDEAAGLAGLMLPGDHVDIILTHKVKGDDGAAGDRVVSETIVRDLRILAVDQALKTENNTTVAVPKTVTLEVDPQQAEKMMLGRTLGTLSLTLRSSFGEAPEDGAGHPFTQDTDISAALRAGRTGAPKDGANQSKSIVIYRGSVPQTATVTR